MSYNLPPGCTAQHIEDAYGEDEPYDDDSCPGCGPYEECECSKQDFDAFESEQPDAHRMDLDIEF